MKLELARVVGRKLTGIDLTIENEVCVVLGDSNDGTDELSRVAAGLARTRSGSVRVDGSDPFRTPKARRAIGLLLATETFRPGATVRAVVAGALEPRGSKQSPESVFERLGSVEWLDRSVESLETEEARTLMLALALSVPPPALLVLSEPLAHLAAAEPRAIVDAINEHVSAGSAVLCSTIRTRDASWLSGNVVVLERGRLTRGPTPSSAAALMPGLPLEFFVRVDAPRTLARQLDESPDVTGVEYDETARPGELIVKGKDPGRLSMAILQAVQTSGVELRALGTSAPPAEVLRAANAGLVRAAYDGAYRARRSATEASV